MAEIANAYLTLYCSLILSCYLGRYGGPGQRTVKGSEVFISYG